MTIAQNLEQKGIEKVRTEGHNEGKLEPCCKRSQLQYGHENDRPFLFSLCIPRTKNDELLIVIDEGPTPRPIPAGSSTMLNELFSVQNKPLDYHYSKSTDACLILKVKLFYRAVRIIINYTDWRAVRSQSLNAAKRHGGASRC